MPEVITQRRALLGYAAIVIVAAVSVLLYQRHVDQEQNRTDMRLGLAIARLEKQAGQLEQNRINIARNAQTAQALCDAAAGARDFWIKVRASTLTLLTDKELSPTERQSNLNYVSALTEVIAAANGLANSCRD